MSPIALVVSEPVRPRMGGIGVRYLELARRLPAAGFAVRLLTPPAGDGGSEIELDGVERRNFARERLSRDLGDCTAVVAQGQLANDVLQSTPDRAVAIDLYDPFLIENLHYRKTLGLDPFRNDLATWHLQLARGDFFLCSSEEQRLFYLGFLTALGRVHPERVEGDPELRSLIDVVPFGTPRELPAARPLLAARRPGERRLLFGGLYDWYDPWTVLAALERLEGVDWRLVIVRSPNAESTPQRLFAEVETHARTRGWWQDRVEPIDWVPAERRYDLLRECDLMVATHRPSLETDLALRTRFLDALTVGCPVVTSAGGTISRQLAAHRAGWVVPAGDAEALAGALREALGGGLEVERRRDAGRRLAESYRWERAIAPLVKFLEAPRRDSSKGRFAARWEIDVPPDSLAFRARRWLRRRLGG